MKSFFSTILISFFAVCAVCAQNSISIELKDSKSKGPLPYANIGVIGKPVGTVSNDAGQVKLELEDKYLKDSIRISLIGYRALTFKVYDFIDLANTQQIFYLEPLKIKIPEIEIKGKKLKTKILGSKTTAKNFTACQDTFKLGQQIGIAVKLRNKESYLKKLNFAVVYSKGEKYKFRINVNQMENGEPGESLLQEAIFLEVYDKVGIQSIDLTKYNIVTQKDIFVGIEFIEEKGVDTFCFSSGFFGKPIWYKNASEAEWELFKIATVGITVEVGQ